jgi:hypothetical protein
MRLTEISHLGALVELLGWPDAPGAGRFPESAGGRA